MKIFILFLLVLISAIIIFLFVRGAESKNGTPPGLINGMLSACSIKPNCICSELKKDATHYISPIEMSSNNGIEATKILKEIIQGMGGTLQLEEDKYFSYTFTSMIFGFVDDLEIRIDDEKNEIHFRSASRVGSNDLGVNKKRINLLKKLYQESTN